MLSCAVALQAASPATASDCRDQDLVLDAFNVKQIRAATRCLINDEREARGRQPVAANRELRLAGERYSRLMVRERFYAHVSPGGSTVLARVRRTSYLDGGGKFLLGENLGFGVGESATPRGLIRAWMASASHRTHILNGRYRDVGVGVARGTPEAGGTDGATYSVVFGRRNAR